MKHLIIYLLIGCINTCIGFGFILLFIYLKIPPELSNFLGYLIGISCSYLLNHFFNFKTKPKHTFFKFIISMLIAYLINLFVLILLFRIWGLNVYVAQIFAAISYTIAGFLLSKFFVWRMPNTP